MKFWKWTGPWKWAIGILVLVVMTAAVLYVYLLIQQSSDQGDEVPLSSPTTTETTERVGQTVQPFACGKWSFPDCAHVPVEQARCFSEEGDLSACEDIVLFPAKSDPSKEIDCRRKGQTIADVVGPNGVFNVETISKPIGEISICDCRCIPVDSVDQSKPYEG